LRRIRFLADLSSFRPEEAKNTISLTGSQLHQLRHVLRAEPGDELEIVDTVWRLRADATVREISAAGAELSLTKIDPFAGTSMLHLICGMPKPAAADLVVEKGTELGVSQFSFFRAERSQGKALVDSFRHRIERFRKIAESAIRQSGARTAPEFAVFDSLYAALGAEHGGNAAGASRYVLVTGSELSGERNPSPGLPALLAEEPCDLSGLTADPAGLERESNFADFSLIVGPEGGLTGAECEAARAFSYREASLGPTTLRVETAVIAACALVGLLRSR
jgi:16S rRNA (uracil1498-N3)-methyltransferase